MKLTIDGLKSTQAWASAGITIPTFDIEAIKKNTLDNPKWIHFGAGNIFRAFVASCQGELLEKGLSDTGIIAVETYDEELIDKIYKPHDNLALVTTLKETGDVDYKVVGSVVESCKGSTDYESLKTAFENPELQMVSFTITEKGYAVEDTDGNLFGIIEQDIASYPEAPKHVMSILTLLLKHRYEKGAGPLSVVSMDNCSHNGDKIKAAVCKLAEKLQAAGHADAGFIEYVQNPEKVAFPLSMIDKITPRPSEDIANRLSEIGFEDTAITVTDKNTYMAPFVNAEQTQYLVIEDLFPNGRPALEKSTGVIFTDRETVNNVETMKVTTCLNPLHTALAVFGCLLSHKKISDEMQDTELSDLVRKMAYDEGLKAVVDPGIINPMDFVDEVINKRFANPYIEDTPQRIATDTSQKVGIRYGVTIQSYMNRADLQVENLLYIPLVIAGWLRYLDGIDDSGEAFTLSPDPLMDYLMSVKEDKRTLLSNADIFGVNLYDIGLGSRIEAIYEEMAAEKGAVRKTLKKHLK